MGFDLLLESGISKVIIQRIIGFGICIISVIIAGVLVIDCRSAMRNVFESKKQEVKEK